MLSSMEEKKGVERAPLSGKLSYLAPEAEVFAVRIEHAVLSGLSDDKGMSTENVNWDRDEYCID